jgi:hypothetical protein
MNTLEANSIRTGSRVGDMVGMDVLSNIPALTRVAEGDSVAFE